MQSNRGRFVKPKAIEILAEKISKSVGSEVLPHEINIAKIAKDKHGVVMTGEYSERTPAFKQEFHFALMHGERCYGMYTRPSTDYRAMRMNMVEVYAHNGHYFTGDGVAVP